jgi:hypothetical protein
MGDHSLIHHLLNEGTEAGDATVSSPIFYGQGDGMLNVTAAATPSILKHSPSPLPAARGDSGSRAGREGKNGREGRGANAAVAVTFRAEDSAREARHFQRGARIVQVRHVIRDARFARCNCVVEDGQRQQQR